MIGLGLILALMAWPAPEQAREAAAQVVEVEGLQTELSVSPEPPPMSMGSSASNPPPQHRAAPPVAGGGTTLGPIVLGVLGGVVLLGLVAVLIHDRARPSPSPRAGSSPAPASLPPPPPQSIVDEADALAASGRFAEAVHALLMRTISALSRHMPVDCALTSREIEGRSRLPAEARVALGELVGAVEITRFGGRSANADDYARCVDCFDRIRAALGGGRR